MTGVARRTPVQVVVVVEGFALEEEASDQAPETGPSKSRRALEGTLSDAEAEDVGNAKAFLISEDPGTVAAGDGPAEGGGVENPTNAEEREFRALFDGVDAMRVIRAKKVGKYRGGR